MLLKVLMIAAAVETAFAAAPFTWKNVNIQGMGYVSGIVAHPAAPHDLYVRTDAGGVYRLDRANSSWIPLLDRFGTDDRAQNADSIAFDPTDPNTLYVGVEWHRARLDKAAAEILVSHSRGRYWQALDLAPRGIAIAAGLPYGGTTGERLAVDPKHPHRIFYGTQNDGLWVKNGPAEWRKVEGGLPATTASPGVCFLLTEPKSGKIYAGVWGSGVWLSSDGGDSWTRILEAPNPGRAVFSSDGALFVVLSGGLEDSKGGSVRRLRQDTWTDITPPGVEAPFSGVTVDPGDPGTVIVSTNLAMTIFRSTDQGDTWKKVPATAAKDQPAYYPVFANATGCCNATVLIDPVQTKRLFVLAGFGVLKTDDVTVEAPEWSWLMNNLEELVVNTVKVPPVVTVPGTNEPGAHLLSGVADMLGFRHADRDTVPAVTFPSFDWVAQANSIAYSALHPESAAFVGWDHPTQKVKTGYTSDNGKTWKPFGDSSPGVAGNIAMSATDPMNLVWAPVRPAPVVYSTDGGNTWKPSMSGSGALPVSWQIGNVWWNPQVLIADMVQASTFYYYANGDFYSSTDGGAHWTKKSNIATAGAASVGYTINVTIVTNPVKAGDIWLTFARNGNQSIPFRLLHSTDGGATFPVVESLASCNYVAFGKGNSDTIPFLYAHGRLSSTDADSIYKSEDMGATWTAISNPDRMQFGSIMALEGDMRTRDLVYVGTGGRGIIYGYGAGSGIPAPSTDTVVNFGSGQAGPISPGEAIAVHGDGIGPATPAGAQYDETQSISSILGGTQVLFDGVPAPLLSTSANQVVAIAPYGIAGHQRTTIEVSYQDRVSPPVELAVQPASPAIFTVDGSGTGQALAIHASTGELNSAANPASVGESLTLYMTGDGELDSPVGDGTVITSSLAPTKLDVRVTMGGAIVPVLYAGGAKGLVAGISQLNMQVPETAPRGPAIPITVTVGGISSKAVVTVATR